MTEVKIKINLDNNETIVYYVDSNIQEVTERLHALLRENIPFIINNEDTKIIINPKFIREIKVIGEDVIE